MEINTLSGNTMPLEIKLDKDYALYKLYSKKKHGKYTNFR